MPEKIITRPCEECGAAFTTPASELRRNRGRFCSCHCSAQRQRRKFLNGIRERLLATREIDPETGCWLWTGFVHPEGYGRTKWNGRGHNVHRLAYHLFRDFDLNSPLVICHDCPGGDNPRCFNPDHLFVGTSGDNTRDAGRKGMLHRAKGEGHFHTTLTEADVIEIRRLKAAGAHGTNLAKRFGVCASTISNIVRRYTWGHIP